MESIRLEGRSEGREGTKSEVLMDGGRSKNLLIVSAIMRAEEKGIFKKLI